MLRILALTFSLLAAGGLATDPVTTERPTPLHGQFFPENYNRAEVERRIAAWKPGDIENVWELSGYVEGDMMISMDRNAVKDHTLLWPYGIVPYFWDNDVFTPDQIRVIRGAMWEIEHATCVQFRQREAADPAWIHFVDGVSCSSSIGRQPGGQTIILSTRGCVHHGVVIHEILHALGFVHEHCTLERDHYVTIHRENVNETEWHNFDAYTADYITTLNFMYDYGSIMHYSRTAFSNNSLDTIVPKDPNAIIGQRNGLSEIDKSKIGKLYADECRKRPRGTLSVPSPIDNSTTGVNTTIPGEHSD